MTTVSMQSGEQVHRPVPQLLTYYLLLAAASLPLFPILGTYLYFRYHTLTYRLDEEGLSMSWGILFRREIHLTYARIQDIHLVSNVVERWLGLAKIQIQTASGSSGAQMVMEGIADHGAMRDFLYAKLRGASAPHQVTSGQASLAQTLEELATELEALKVRVESSHRGGSHV